MGSWKVYLYRGAVHVPTTARLDSGAWLDVEPVLSAAADDRAAIERAITAAIRRGNPAMRHPRKFPKPVLLAHAKARSWSEIDRGGRGWAIDERDGVYTLTPYRRAAPRGWEQDTARAIALAPGLSPEEVGREVARIVAGDAAG